MKEKILWMDCETGGLFPGTHSLLTIAMAITDSELNIIKEHEWKIKSTDYRISAYALKVNNIDLVKHNEEAQEPYEVISEIQEFIKEGFDEGEDCLIGGHNVKFDIDFLSNLFRENKVKMSGALVHRHRQIDTCNLLRVLHHIGVLNEPVFKLQEALSYFGIDSPIEMQHVAIGDVRSNIKLYAKLKDLILGGRNV